MRGKFLKRAAGTARARPRECRTFQAGALFPDCSKAAGFESRPVFSEFVRKNRSRARLRQNPAFHLLPPCPCHYPAVRTRAACSSDRCRALPAEDIAEFPKVLDQFFLVTVRAARGSRSAATRERLRSSTASERAPAARSFRSGCRAPAQWLLPAGRCLGNRRS